MHLDPTTIGVVGSLLLAASSLVLHFTPKYTVAGRIATWLEQNEKSVQAIAEAIAAAAKKP